VKRFLWPTVYVLCCRLWLLRSASWVWSRIQAVITTACRCTTVPASARRCSPDSARLRRGQSVRPNHHCWSSSGLTPRYIAGAFRWTGRSTTNSANVRNLSVYQTAIFDALQLCYRRLWHGCLLLSSVCNECVVAKRREIGFGCYWSLTENRILAFKWHENCWPWLTMKDYNGLWYADRASNRWC